MSAHVWYLGASYRDVINQGDYKTLIDQSAYRPKGILKQHNIEGLNRQIKLGAFAGNASKEQLFAYLAIINESESIPKDQLYTDADVMKILEKIEIQTLKNHEQKEKEKQNQIKLQKEQKEKEIEYQQQKRKWEEEREEREMKQENERKIKQEKKRIEEEKLAIFAEENRKKLELQRQQYENYIRPPKFDINSVVITFKDNSSGTAYDFKFSDFDKKKVSDIQSVRDKNGDVSKELWNVVFPDFRALVSYHWYGNRH